MSNDLLRKQEVLQVKGSKALGRNCAGLQRKLLPVSRGNRSNQAIPTCLQYPVQKMRLPQPWCYHSPRTAKLSYLSMSSPLVSGALPRAALLRLWSVPCSVWRRGFVSDPGLRGPATQLSDTSWPSEEPAG